MYTCVEYDLATSDGGAQLLRDITNFLPIANTLEENFPLEGKTNFGNTFKDAEQFIKRLLPDSDGSGGGGGPAGGEGDPADEGGAPAGTGAASGGNVDGVASIPSDSTVSNDSAGPCTPLGSDLGLDVPRFADLQHDPEFIDLGFEARDESKMNTEVCPFIS